MEYKRTLAVISCALAISAPVSAQDSWNVVPNAAISGHNTLPMKGSVAQCKSACEKQKGFECKSFDYHIKENKCDLSDKSADDVGGLKTNYAGNPYTHYERVFSASSSTPAPTVNVTARNLGALRINGDDDYTLKQVSEDGTSRAWVWQAPSGNQYLYYENNRTNDTIKLTEANTPATMTINLRTKTIKSSHGKSYTLDNLEAKPASFRDFHTLEVLGQTFAGYYADGNNVYGGKPPDCSHGVDDAYVTLFLPTCIIHDQYYNAPWQQIFGESWNFYFKGDNHKITDELAVDKARVIDDEESETPKLAREVSESAIWNEMDNICDDLETGVQIATLGFCHTAKHTWYDNLKRHGTFYKNQKGLDSQNYDVVYAMPKTKMVSLLKKADKAIDTRAAGTNYMVEIDCNVDDVSDESTNDMITVEFYNASNRVIGSRSANGVGSCTTIDKNFSIVLNDIPSYVRVKTDGNDGYMIDELWVYQDGNEISKHGVDNDKGWCLSTDSRDAEGSWKNHVTKEGCRSSHRFDIKGKATLSYGVEIDCNVDGISNEGTSNTISVDFYSADGKRVGRANKTNFANTSPDSCAWETNPVFETILSAPASKIRVRNNGNDAFMIDKIWLLKGGERVETYGKNDSNGWCLSTDPNDGNGNWKGYVSTHRNYGKPQASCVKDLGFNY